MAWKVIVETEREIQDIPLSRHHFREHNPLPLLRPFRTNDFGAHRDFLEFLDVLSSDPKR